MLNRRHALIAFAGAAAPSYAAGPARYTAATAPDVLTKAILSRPIKYLHERLTPGCDFQAVMNGVIPRVIEQNFAARDGAATARVLQTLSADELHLMAQVYSAAGGGRLLDLLALRLDGRGLGELVPYFGFEPVYRAVWRFAPAKLQEYLEYVEYGRGTEMVAQTMGAVPSVDMTIPQIYAAYRSAALGSLSVRGALYMTTLYAGGHVATVYYATSTVGGWLAPLIAQHAPSLYDTMGWAVNNIVTNLSNAASNSSLYVRGAAQLHAATSFSLGSMFSTIAATGGDYGVAMDWYYSSGGGSGGGNCPPEGCPKVR